MYLYFSLFENCLILKYHICYSNLRCTISSNGNANNQRRWWSPTLPIM